MFKISTATVLTTLAILSGTAALSEQRYQQTSCATYGDHATGCDECFQGRTIQPNTEFYPGMKFSAGSQDRVYWEKENTTLYEWEALNRDTSWAVSDNLIGYDPNFTWYTSESGARYSIIREGDNIRMYATRRGKGITLLENRGAPSDGVPDARLTYIVNYHTLLGQGSQSDRYIYTSCTFYDAG